MSRRPVAVIGKSKACPDCAQSPNGDTLLSGPTYIALRTFTFRLVSIGFEMMKQLIGPLTALTLLLLLQRSAAVTPKSFQSRASPALLSRASHAFVAPAPLDAAYSREAEDDRIDILPGWGKPEFGLFSGMRQDGLLEVAAVLTTAHAII